MICVSTWIAYETRKRESTARLRRSIEWLRDIENSRVRFEAQNPRLNANAQSTQSYSGLQFPDRDRWRLSAAVSLLAKPRRFYYGSPGRWTLFVGPYVLRWWWPHPRFYNYRKQAERIQAQRDALRDAA